MRAWSQSTPLGDVTVVVSDAGLTRLWFSDRPIDELLATEPELTAGRDRVLARELDQYFAGRRKIFATPIDLGDVRSDHFGRRVIETLHADVAWGETVSYGELADMAGAPRAARAVGNVMRHSPISIVVPCHRVISADGRIGGYGGSAERKRALLVLEGVHLH